MKHILLPTDFSDNSWNAIAYAVQLYKDESCTFYLFNAYTPIIYQTEYFLSGAAQFGLIDAIKETSIDNLKTLHVRILKQFSNNPNHIFETISRFDTLIFGIKELIEERPIDLMVMGTTGATGAKEILFGSNTVQVFKEIKCPIMAIPANFEYEAPHEILFPTDLEVDYLKSHLHIVEEIAKTHQSRVNAMHVSTGNELTEVQQHSKLQLEKMFKNVGYIFHDFEYMDISDAINSFLVKHKINFLVMVNNKHSFFENLFFKNTINQIGFHLNVPFLVIRSKKTN